MSLHQSIIASTSPEIEVSRLPDAMLAKLAKACIQQIHARLPDSVADDVLEEMEEATSVVGLFAKHCDDLLFNAKMFERFGA